MAKLAAGDSGWRTINGRRVRIGADGKLMFGGPQAEQKNDEDVKPKGMSKANWEHNKAQQEHYLAAERAESETGVKQWPYPNTAEELSAGKNYKEHEKWWKGNKDSIFTPEEVAAVKLYVTSKGAMKMNGLLHSLPPGAPIPDNQKHTKAMDAAVRKAPPLSKDTTFFRATDYDFKAM